MKERPILMTGWSVRGILAGRKTVTRRPVKPQPAEFWDDGVGTPKLPREPYRLGQSLWVRESWGVWDSRSRVLDRDYLFELVEPDGETEEDRLHAGLSGDMRLRSGYELVYRATSDLRDRKGWRPSIHMPKWAARIWLRVTDVRVERVQDISTEDIVAEGLSTTLREHDAVCHLREQWQEAWDSIHGRKPELSWHANPWVWVVSFERIERGEVSDEAAE